jgi:hypothetical protein
MNHNSDIFWKSWLNQIWSLERGISDAGSIPLHAECLVM